MNLTDSLGQKPDTETKSSGNGVMLTICEIVLQVLQSGYLTVEAEQQLQQLFAAQYDLADVEALTRLQQAARYGLVKQQSRELVNY